MVYVIDVHLKKIKKIKWKLDDDQLVATLIVFDNRAPMKIIPQIHGIPIEFLWDHYGIGNL